MHRQQCSCAKQINSGFDIDAEQLSKLLAAQRRLKALGNFPNDRNRYEDYGTIRKFSYLYQKGGYGYFLADKVEEDGMRIEHGVARTQNGC